MFISIHPTPYDVARARSERDYAKTFAYGWRPVEIRRGALFAEVLTTSVWSPARLNDGRRRLESFAGTRLLALDFENPEYPLAQAVREWCDTIHWIGTTRNHQREKGGVTCDRFRLVVPWADEITDPELYRYNYELVGEHYGADLACKDTVRLFFPCQELVSSNLEGEFQPVKPLPPDWIARRELLAGQTVARVAAGFVPLAVRRRLEDTIPIGKRNVTWYGFAKDLAPYGFDGARILQLISASATYKGAVMSPSLIREIEGCVSRGLRDGHRAFAALGDRATTGRSGDGQCNGYQGRTEKESTPSKS